MSTEQLQAVSPPVVSVAMVVRNMERFVAEAIESILDQTFRDLEFVIVDFGSTDRSLSIISQYQEEDCRIKLHVIAPCSLPEARNASLQFTRGRYIALMDADDVAFPDRLERQIAYLENHAEIALLGGAIECTDSSGIRQFTRQFPLTDGDIRTALLRGTVLHQTTVMLRREVLDTIKGYRRAFALAEDYDLWLRVVEHFQVTNLAEPLVYYRLHSDQVSVRRLRQEVMCSVAARAAAEIRASGSADPLWEIDEITPEVLVALGVKEAALTEALVFAYCDWMNAMLLARNEEAALDLIEELLKLPRTGSSSSAIFCNACLTAARIKYRRGAYLSAMGSLIRAIAIRPIVMARPIKRLLSRAPVGLTPEMRPVHPK